MIGMPDAKFLNLFAIPTYWIFSNPSVSLLTLSRNYTLPFLSKQKSLQVKIEHGFILENLLKLLSTTSISTHWIKKYGDLIKVSSQR